MGLLFVHLVRERVFARRLERVGLIYLQQSYQTHAYDLDVIQI